MQEYFDILNPDGTPTGKKKLRSEVHRDGDWHKAMNLWIINSKKEVLIQQRSSSKDSYADFWDISVCGHLEAGETSISTAQREAREELGIDFEQKELEYILTDQEVHILNEGKFVDKEFRDIFLLEKNFSPEDFTLQESEVQKIEWIHLLEFQEMYYQKKRKFVPHDGEYQAIFPLLIERYKF